MSLENIYGKHERVRTARRQGKAAAEIGRAAMEAVEGDFTGFITSKAGYEIGLQRSDGHREGETVSLLNLVINVHDRDDALASAKFASVFEHDEYQEIKVAAYYRYDITPEEAFEAFQEVRDAVLDPSVQPRL